MTDTSVETPWDFGESISVPFQLPGHYGRRIIIWTSALMLLLTAAIVLLAWPIIKNLIPTFMAIAKNPDSPETVFAIMGAYLQFGALFSVAGLLSLVLLSSAEASMLAAYLRGDVKQGIPLRFDGDMWRVIGARLLVGLLVGGAIFCIYVVILLILFGTLAVFGSGATSGAGMVAMSLLPLIVIIAFICTSIWLSVRLSPFAAVAVRDRLFSLGDGWRVSKGRVLPMIGGFVILFIILGIAQNVLMYGGFFALAGASGVFSMGDQFQNAATPGEALDLLKSMVNPLVITIGALVLILLTVLGVIGRLCIAGVPAHVASLDAGPEQIADVF